MNLGNLSRREALDQSLIQDEKQEDVEHTESAGKPERKCSP